MRFDNSPDLFGCGCGVSTVAPIDCEWCGKTYNADNWDEKEQDCKTTNVPSVCHIMFAGKQICDCCFEKIESEIWRRRNDVLKWFSKILEQKQKNLAHTQELLAKAKKGGE